MSRTMPPRRPSDDDPTGVRDLLATLPDPGPMPRHIIWRIAATLADEEAQRVQGGPTRLRGSGRRSGRRRGFVIGVAATAAGLAVAGTVGVHTLMNREATTRPSDGSAELTQQTDRASANTPERLPTATNIGLPVVHIQLSNTAYTPSNLGLQARATIANRLDPLRSGAAEGVTIGPIGTPQGVMDCMSALGLKDVKTVFVDLGRYEDRPAALLMTDVGDHQDVRIVPRSCGMTDRSILAGPAPLQ